MIGECATHLSDEGCPSEGIPGDARIGLTLEDAHRNSIGRVLPLCSCYFAAALFSSGNLKLNMPRSDLH